MNGEAGCFWEGHRWQSAVSAQVPGSPGVNSWGNLLLLVGKPWGIAVPYILQMKPHHAIGSCVGGWQKAVRLENGFEEKMQEGGEGKSPALWVGAATYGSGASGQVHRHTWSAASQDLAWRLFLNISFFLFPYTTMKTADVNKNSSCQYDVELTACGYSPAAAFTAQYGTNILPCSCCVLWLPRLTQEKWATTIKTSILQNWESWSRLVRSHLLNLFGSIYKVL